MSPKPESQRTDELFRSYPGQFAQAPDPYFVALSPREIMSHIQSAGEAPALNDLCLSVAAVAEAMAFARVDRRS